MTQPPPHDPSLSLPPNSQPSEATTIVSPERILEQHLNLKQEVEQLYRRMDRMRGLLQTLVTGLVIAVFMTIVVVGWFAYRFLIQERLYQERLQEEEAARQELLAQIEEVAAELSRQQQLQDTLQQQIPEELTTLTDTIQSNQRQVQLLLDRLKNVEALFDDPDQSEEEVANE